MAIFIFDRCPKIFADRAETWTQEFVYRQLCACYLLAVKLMEDLPRAHAGHFRHVQGDCLRRVRG